MHENRGIKLIFKHFFIKKKKKENYQYTYLILNTE